MAALRCEHIRPTAPGPPAVWRPWQQLAGDYGTHTWLFRFFMEGDFMGTRMTPPRIRGGSVALVWVRVQQSASLLAHMRTSLPNQNSKKSSCTLGMVCAAWEALRSGVHA